MRKYVIMGDSDASYDFAEIPRFLAKLAEGWDIVTGKKMGRYEKRAVSSVFAASRRRRCWRTARSRTSAR